MLGNSACYGQGFDAMDLYNCIPDEWESSIYPDIYSEFDGWSENNSDISNGEYMSITDLKNRYNSYKQSVGFEIKLYGFSFF